jgi:methyltransferase (TIGR00027 family)
MRTDDDSWGITESVGATAIGVALMRATETRRPDALFHDPYAQILVSEVRHDAWERLERDSRGESLESLGDEGEGDRIGYMSAFMTARTVYFDEYFAQATAAGVRQIVILAAGLDARAYRLDWPADTVVFELDQPKVLEFKAVALAKHDVTPRIERRAVAVDLRHDWPAALTAAGFDRALPTAWLAEGLLRYLPADAQDRLLGDILSLSAPGSRFASNSPNGPQPEVPAQLLERRGRMLERLGIDINPEELVYPHGDRTAPADWFAAHGWAADTATVEEVLTAHNREIPGEFRELAVSRHTLTTAVAPKG